MLGEFRIVRIDIRRRRGGGEAVGDTIVAGRRVIELRCQVRRHAEGRDLTGEIDGGAAGALVERLAPPGDDQRSHATHQARLRPQRCLNRERIAGGQHQVGVAGVVALPRHRDVVGADGEIGCVEWRLPHGAQRTTQANGAAGWGASYQEGPRVRRRASHGARGPHRGRRQQARHHGE